MSAEQTRNPIDARLLQGSVSGQLLRMSASMMIGFLAGAAYNITDTYFVSMLGTLPLAAMGFTFPIVMIVHGLVMGLGVGVASVLSRMIGQGDQQGVRRMTMHALYLGLCLTAVLVVIGYLTLDPVIRLMGATEDIIPMTLDYMRIWLGGILFLVVPMMGNNAIRATGDTLSPSLIMSADLLLNLALDPIFIFGWGPVPAMGIKGAAIATVLARCAALAASLYILGYRKRLLTLRRPLFAGLLDSWKQIAFIGLPAAATNILRPVAMGIITRIISGFGPAAVAAMTAGMRIEFVVVIPIIALGASMVPFVGQNWGAGRMDRVLGAQKMGYRFAVSWGALCLLVLAGFAEPVAGLFSEDPAVLIDLCLYLVVMPLAFGFRGMAMASMGTLNAINRPFDAAFTTLFHLFALQWPLAVLGARLYGFSGVLMGLVLADILAALISGAWVLVLLRRAQKGVGNGDK